MHSHGAKDATLSHLNTTWEKLENRTEFVDRHIGPNAEEIQVQLSALKLPNLDKLIEETIPQNILSHKGLDLGPSQTEASVLAAAKVYAAENKVFKSYIGQGYYGTLTPNVILRNIFENPGWYTAYTPYQAEIAQGRLEALLNFQTMIRDLTGLEIANSSLLDEGTAAAEAMAMAHAHQNKKNASVLFVDEGVHPQTLAVIQTRALPLGLTVRVGSMQKFDFAEDCFAALIQNPRTDGAVVDLTPALKKLNESKIVSIVACDLLALTLLKSPGEMGADIAMGSAQRFGVPLGFGGPHAAFLATRDEFKRSMPGRLVGVSIDSSGRPALRLALQTREQHIRREKATSNICTAQVLLAVMASMYAVYHGPQGLKRIAQRTHRLAAGLGQTLKGLGFSLAHSEAYFDTLAIAADKDVQGRLKTISQNQGVNFRYSNNWVGISLDETTSAHDVETICEIFAKARGGSQAAPKFSWAEIEKSAGTQVAKASHVLASPTLIRTSEYLTSGVFNRYHSETEMLRYIFRLQKKDLALTDSMIPLGSCTMKLNATTEMIPVTWPEFSNLHPFAPKDQTQGYFKMVHELEGMLSEITGFAAVSVQPNAGSQGEYAGLLAIRDYHLSRGDKDRVVCLIPSSAHGTNPASAVMAGMKVVVVACDSNGNVDLNDLKLKAQQHSAQLSALMITYPSTHGVFEEGIRDICDMIHKAGGQVYMDGANFNALVGLCKPGEFGPDVCHLNLHKTFCIPHGGGGPGVGPIGVREHLIKFLPSHHERPDCAPGSTAGAVSAAPWGSASILPISWAYIKMMGSEGLKKATQVAILNANYIAARLEDSYPILYRGKNGRVAHECILDLRPLKASAGIEAEDVAKRLMDYGFHAPTMSWPVTGTLMVEPTESESKHELDRFCDAMISIRNEVKKIEAGTWPKDENPLKRAPHTQHDVVATEWQRPYSREEAVFPSKWVAENKFWPSVGRINNVYGDRNLVCSCEPLEKYNSL